MIKLQEYIQSGGPKSAIRQVKSKEEEMELAKIAPLFFKFPYQGWTMFPSIHAAARSYERRPDMEVDDWKKLHRRVADYLQKSTKKQSGEYLFYSKSLQQGYVAVVAYNTKTVKIITVLPRGRSNPDSNTTKIIVENKEIELLDIIELE